MSLITGLFPSGDAGEDLLVMMAAIAAMFCTYAVWQALLVRDPVKASLKRLQERRTRLHGDLIEQCFDAHTTRSGVP